MDLSKAAAWVFGDCADVTHFVAGVTIHLDVSHAF